MERRVLPVSRPVAVGWTIDSESIPSPPIDATAIFSLAVKHKRGGAWLDKPLGEVAVKCADLLAQTTKSGGSGKPSNTQN